MHRCAGGAVTASTAGMCHDNMHSGCARDASSFDYSRIFAVGTLQCVAMCDPFSGH